MRRHLLLPPADVLAGVLAAVLTALLGLVTTAAPAWAHTRLVSSTPSPSPGVPAEAPGAVVLAFSDPVQPGLSAVSVTGAAYRVLAADGHPVTGTELSALWTTGYGGLLLAKAAVLLVLGAAGWLHRRGALAPVVRGDAGAFARPAAAEVGLMAVALGLAVALTRIAA